MIKFRKPGKKEYRIAAKMDLITICIGIVLVVIANAFDNPTYIGMGGILAIIIGIWDYLKNRSKYKSFED